MGKSMNKTQDTTKRLRRDGFTLVELLVAVFIAAFGITAILSAITQGIRGIRLTDASLKAEAASIRQMEKLRNTPFAQLVDQPMDATFDLPLGATGHVFVTAYNGSPSLKLVTVAVTLDPSGNFTTGSPAWRLTSLFSKEVP